MGIVFAVRGDSLDARYSNGGKLGIAPNGGWTVTSDGGALSGSLLVAASNNNAKGLCWPGRYNTANGRAFSVLVRYKPGYTGTPSASRPMFPNLLAAGGRSGRIETFHAVTTGQVTAVVVNEAGTAIVNTTLGAWSPTSTTYYDVVYTFGGTTATNDFKVYVDATLLGQATPSAAYSSSWANTWFSEICMGGGVSALNYNAASIDEIVIWDSVIDPTSVTLNSGTGSLNGASRTSLVSVSALDGSSYTDPGVANVKTGTGYTYAGASQTGTYDGSDRWTDPGEANVKTGTAYKANSTSNNKTGTYTGSDRWTDPGISNVRSGTAYKADSTTNNRTGTAAIPAAADVRNGTATDATTGNLVVPTAAQVKTGVAFESSGASTGTYTGSDRWTDPGVANVRSGTAYKADSTTNNKTGTLDLPSEADVRSGVTYDGATKTGTYTIGDDVWTDPRALTFAKWLALK